MGAQRARFEHAKVVMQHILKQWQSFLHASVFSSMKINYVKGLRHHIREQVLQETAGNMNELSSAVASAKHESEDERKKAALMAMKFCIKRISIFQERVRFSIWLVKKRMDDAISAEHFKVGEALENTLKAIAADKVVSVFRDYRRRMMESHYHVLRSNFVEAEAVKSAIMWANLNANQKEESSRRMKEKNAMRFMRDMRRVLREVQNGVLSRSIHQWRMTATKELAQSVFKVMNRLKQAKRKQKGL